MKLQAQNLSTIAFSLGLLTLPLALWFERVYPERWLQPVFYPIIVPTPIVQCYGAATVLLGNADTGYRFINLPAASSACDRFTQHQIVPVAKK